MIRPRQGVKRIDTTVLTRSFFQNIGAHCHTPQRPPRHTVSTRIAWTIPGVSLVEYKLVGYPGTYPSMTNTTMLGTRVPRSICAAKHATLTTFLRSAKKRSLFDSLAYVLCVLVSAFIEQLTN